MVENGARAILAECWACLHEGELPINRFPPEIYVPDVALRVRCSRCGSKNVKTQPLWGPR